MYCLFFFQLSCNIVSGLLCLTLEECQAGYRFFRVTKTLASRIVLHGLPFISKCEKDKTVDRKKFAHKKGWHISRDQNFMQTKTKNKYAHQDLL